MSNIDRQRREAVALLEQVGYRWTGSQWEIPAAADLPRLRQLSLVDIGDMMCSHLVSVMPIGSGDNMLAARTRWLHEAWDDATGFSGRHLQARPDGTVGD